MNEHLIDEQAEETAKVQANPKKCRKIRCVIGRPSKQADRTPWWMNGGADPKSLRFSKQISGKSPEKQHNPPQLRQNN